MSIVATLKPERNLNKNMDDESINPEDKEELADALKESGAWDELEDEQKDEIDHDALVEELSDELMNGDADEALTRMEDLGIDIDELDI